MTQLRIVTGCAGAGKTERLLEHYRAALVRAQAERRPGTCLWLTPTRRIQQTISRQLLARCGSACFAPNVLTFDLFAEKILAAADQPASPISPVMKRLMLRRITSSLQEQGELQHFQPIAGTTGFLDVVSAFISELKREEIWPERFVAACEQRKSAFARRDLELGLIYEQYQRHLAEQKWYDNEGRFWLARTALGDGVRGPFANVTCLVVDGFADFTQTQYEILGYLAGWIEEVSISLPVENPLSRNDLFAKPQAAVARIREHLPEATSFQIDRLRLDALDRTETPASSTTNLSAVAGSKSSGGECAESIRVIADRLFCNPRFCSPASTAAGLEIVAATGQAGEWEAIARRIKGLLSNAGPRSRRGPAAPPARPQDIVIGLRSINDDGPRLREYLQSAGLPAWCEAEAPFTSSCIVKAVLSLLEFELRDWPFERLLAILDSNYFQPSWPELDSGQAARSVATALRRLRLHEGRELMLRSLARNAAEMPPESTSRRESVSDLARRASPLLNRLSRSLDRLRRSHTLADWADVLAAVAADHGWIRPTVGSNDPLSVNESRDLDLLQRILRTAAEADEKLSGTNAPRKMALPEFASELRDLLSHETLASPPEPGGCIRILSMEQIRNLDVPHLFMTGLTENSFPMSRADDCLLGESERQDFISRGIALRHRLSHHADEMLLFYSVVTRARRSLTISYPAVNTKGQPVFPSPYVTALTSLFQPDAIATSHEGNLDPVPSTDQALTLTDVRLAAVMEARSGHPELYRAALEFDPLRHPSWNTLAACDVAEHRFHQRGFTAFEGRVELTQNQSVLQQRFGPRHQFSATELEMYARCPFQFWMSYVLGIGPMESPEEGTDFAARGTMLHVVLAQLLAEGSLTDPEALRIRFHELLRGQFDRAIPETDLQRALLRIEQLILEQWADAFAEQQVDYEQRFDAVLKSPSSLPPEISFGKLPDSPGADDKVHPAIQFGRDENSVQLRGRIDRVDIGSNDGRQGYVVVDYKTGQRPSASDEDVISGRTVQLPLYLLAIKRLGLVSPTAVPYQMGYWALHDTGFKTASPRSKFEAISPSKIEWLEMLLDHLLPQLANEIRSGRFVVENDDLSCTGRCPYRTVCRVNQIRPLAELLNKQSPPRLHPDDIAAVGQSVSRVAPT